MDIAPGSRHARSLPDPVSPAVVPHLGLLWGLPGAEGRRALAARCLPPQPGREPNPKAVTVAASWTYCSCGHTADEHAEGGKCRAKSLDGWPCECPAFDDTADSRVLHVSPVGDGIAHDTSTNEPDCVCGPTVQPVPGADGSMGWLIVHHSLDGRELTETTA